MTLPDRPTTLGVFFTYRVGLSTWEKRGLLSRELALYKRLARDQFEKIYFFTYEKERKELKAELLAQGIEVKDKKYSLPNFLYSFCIPFIYRKEMKECHVYKTTQLFGSWSAVLAKWLYKKPLIVRAGFALSTNLRQSGMLPRIMARLIEFLSLSSADKVIVTTSQIQNFYRGKNKNIIVIPNFVDTKLFFPVVKTFGSQFHLLFVGRLSAEKNISNLIFAVKDMENIILTIIGEGEERKNLGDLAVGSKAQIRFLGAVPHAELPQYFSEADIFVLPSLVEGHPKVIIEAMAAGLPIVASDVRGINTLLEHGRTGFLVSPNAQAIRAGIENLLNDPEKRNMLGMNARREAEQEFSFEKIVALEKSIYEIF